MILISCQYSVCMGKYSYMRDTTHNRAWVRNIGIVCFIFIQFLGIAINLIKQQDCYKQEQSIEQQFSSRQEGDVRVLKEDMLNHFDCGMSFGVPAPIVYVKDDTGSVGVLPQSIVFNIVLYAAVFFAVMRGYALFKQQRYTRVGVESILCIVGLFIAAILLQLSFRYSGLMYTGGPVIRFPSLIPSTQSFVDIGAEYVFYVLTMLAAGFFSVYTWYGYAAIIFLYLVLFGIVVYRIQKIYIPLSYKKLLTWGIVGFIFFYLFMSYSAFITQGVVDLNCLHNNSGCDG